MFCGMDLNDILYTIIRSDDAGAKDEPMETWHETRSAASGEGVKERGGGSSIHNDHDERRNIEYNRNRVKRKLWLFRNAAGVSEGRDKDRTRTKTSFCTYSLLWFWFLDSWMLRAGDGGGGEGGFDSISDEVEVELSQMET